MIVPPIRIVYHTLTDKKREFLILTFRLRGKNRAIKNSVMEGNAGNFDHIHS